MANDTVQITYIGGPCDGRTFKVTVDLAIRGALVCKGVTYVPDPDGPPLPPKPPYGAVIWIPRSVARAKENRVPILLGGGPCAGELRKVTLAVARSGRLTCHGATYVPDPRDVNWPPKKPYTVERWVPNWIAARIVAGRPPRPARNVSGAWHRLMHTFAHTAPHEIKRLKRATARMDRLAYRLRRS